MYKRSPFRKELALLNKSKPTDRGTISRGYRYAIRVLSGMPKTSSALKLHDFAVAKADTYWSGFQ